MSALDFVEGDVRPEHELLLVVEVEGDGVLQTAQDGRVLGPVSGHAPDVHAVRKDEVRFTAYKQYRHTAELTDNTGE